MEISLQNIIGIATVIANIGIAYRTISTNKHIAKENAGKNRVIYSIEEINFDATNPESLIELNKKLSSGNYTILSTYIYPGNFNAKIYSLGKIKS